MKDKRFLAQNTNDKSFAIHSILLTFRASCCDAHHLFVSLSKAILENIHFNVIEFAWIRRATKKMSGEKWKKGEKTSRTKKKNFIRGNEIGRLKSIFIIGVVYVWTLSSSSRHTAMVVSDDFYPIIFSFVCVSQHHRIEREVEKKNFDSSRSIDMRKMCFVRSTESMK